MRLADLQVVPLAALCMSLSLHVAAAKGVGGSVNGATVWVPDYNGCYVLINDFASDGTLGADRPLVSFSTSSGRVSRAGHAVVTPFSLTLPDGKIAAIHGNSLVIAVPHGDAAARTLRQELRA